MEVGVGLEGEWASEESEEWWWSEKEEKLECGNCETGDAKSVVIDCAESSASSVGGGWCDDLVSDVTTTIG